MRDQEVPREELEECIEEHMEAAGLNVEEMKQAIERELARRWFLVRREERA